MSAYSYNTPCNANLKSAGRRGFSAVELVAVATIIAILSLILVQSLQNRVEQAREARVLTDLGEFRDMQTLIFAETSRYVRLQDLDNTKIYTTDTTAAAVDIEVPGLFYSPSVANVTVAELVDLDPGVAIYNRLRANMSTKWNGPYTNFTEYVKLGDLYADGSLLLSVNGGPIYFDNAASIPDVDDDRYPLDPWGNPYIFVPRYHIDPLGQDIIIGGRAYSMGPDGYPGSIPATVGENYFPPDVRPLGNLGTGDDLVFEF